MDYDQTLEAHRKTLDALPDDKDIAPDVHIGDTSRVTRIGAYWCTDID